jgi:hypothetical protein
VSNRTEQYVIRIDNSVCDVVTLRSPTGCYERDGKTLKGREWYERAFPGRQGILMSHINPSETVDRICYVYMNVEKQSDYIGQEEEDYTNFKLTPTILHEKITKDNWRRHIFVTKLDNLRNVSPNIVKREKILGDGKTNVMLRDMSKLMLPFGLKKYLEKYDYSKFVEGSIPDKKDCGTVTKVHTKGVPLPVEVTFPDGKKFLFETEDLHCFHEVED